MITIPLEEHGKPLYMQIYEHIKKEIRAGSFPAGFHIPSKRKLASYLGVSVNTIDASYSQLLSEGFIYSLPQKGYFVCEMDELTRLELPDKEKKVKKEEKPSGMRVRFSIDKIDASKFPYNTWRKIMKNCFNEYDKNLLSCTPPQGDEPLRESIAKYLYQSRGVHCRPGQIVIGAGTDHLLQILSYILKNECSIAMENPVYHKAHYFFNRMGHHVLPIDVDSMGIPVEPLDQFHHIAVYITPSHQFPLGISMPIGRRIKLLNWANQGESRYIIEDDYDSEFRYDAKPIPSLQSIDENGKVIYLGTFSKSISPSLRISYMVLPEALVEVYQKSYTFFSSPVSKLEQLILNDFICEGHFEAHVNKMRKVYKKKREILLQSLEVFGDNIEVMGEKAGHHLLVGLKGNMEEAQMCQKAKAAGVKVYPISPYFIGTVPQKYKGKVLLGFGALSEKEIREGVALLYEAWQESISEE